MKLKLSILIGALLALSILLSGCATGLTPSSWPALTADANNAYVAAGPSRRSSGKGGSTPAGAGAASSAACAEGRANAARPNNRWVNTVQLPWEGKSSPARLKTEVRASPTCRASAPRRAGRAMKSRSEPGRTSASRAFMAARSSRLARLRLTAFPIVSPTLTQMRVPPPSAGATYNITSGCA